MLLLSLGTAARAEPGGAGIEVRWQAPEECPGEPEVRAAVERHVGRPLAAMGDGRLAIVARVQRVEAGWALTVSAVTRTGTQERSLRYAHGCARLAEAAAVLIAMTIDPAVLGRMDPAALELLARAETATPEPAPEPPTSVPVAPEPVSVEGSGAAEEPVIPVEARREGAAEEPVILVEGRREATPVRVSAGPAKARRARAIGGAARASASLGYGDLPAVGGGVTGALALRVGRFQAEAGGGGWFMREREVEGAGTARFELWMVSLRAGAVLALPRRFEIPLLLGAEAGQIRVRGVQLAGARTPWVALSLGTGVAFVPRPRVAIVLGIEGLVPLTRPRFVVEGAGEIFRPQALAVRVGLGFEVRFGGETRGRKSP